MKNKLELQPFIEKDLPLFYEWAKREHVQKTWFIQGYDKVEAIHHKVKGNGYEFPFMIMYEKRPIGYLQYCDLTTCRQICPKPDDIFPEDVQGTYCFDIFIAEESCLEKGIGTEVVKKLCRLLSEKPGIKRIMVDPNSQNTRAIRCYEKAGFKPAYIKHDGVMECFVMELMLLKEQQNSPLV